TQPTTQSTLFPYTTLFRSERQQLAPLLARWKLDLLSPHRNGWHVEHLEGTLSGRRTAAGYAEAHHVPGPFPGTLSGRRQNRLLRSEEHTSELQSPYDLVCR